MAARLRAALRRARLVSSRCSAAPELFLGVQDALAEELRSVTKELYDLYKSHELPDWAGSPLGELVIDNFDDEQVWQELELQNEATLKQLRHQVTQLLSKGDFEILHRDDEGSEAGGDAQDNDDGDGGDGDDCYSMEGSDSSGDSSGGDSSGGGGSKDKLAKGGTREKRKLDAGEGADSESSTERSSGSRKKGARGKTQKRTPGEQQRGGTGDEGDATDSDVDFDIDELEAESKRPGARDARKAPADLDVEDDFFKVDQMEAFLEAEEKRDERQRLRAEGKAWNDEDDDGEEEVDLFVDQLSDYDDDDDDDEDDARNKRKTKKAKKSSRDLKYKDYFTGDDGSGRHRKAVKEKRVTFEDEDDEGSDDMEYDLQDVEEGEGPEAGEGPRPCVLSDDSEGEDIGDVLGGKRTSGGGEGERSSFEKREDKLKKRIKQLEEAALSEKPWQLLGEVTAQKRPENSLLEEGLIFDHAVRMAPVITEETTMKLEDIIKQRIKDQAWDDVERKHRPKEDAFEYKKRVVLDQEKSKISLAEVYEQEYLKQVQEKKEEEEENPKHVEIKKMMGTLFLKLDALSNFHFMPKPPVPEMKVVVNVPAITMEEVAPVTMSDAALLAPEEIKEKTKGGQEVGDLEKTASQRKRERRLKKLKKRTMQHERQRRQKTLEGKKPGLDGKLGKRGAEQKLRQLARDGKVSLLKDDGKGKALRSSQAFFAQLQEQVRAQVKGDKAKGSRSATRAKVSASKLKL